MIPFYRLLCLPLLATLMAVQARAGVDSVVTFNELHYHPTLTQTSGEWVELKNQNDVDVDLSGWRLDGGVDFVFPPGTVIRGGGYVVIAQDPAALMSAAGITGVLGPQSNGWAFCTQPCHRWAAAAAHRAVGSNAYDEEAMVRCQSLPSRS